MHNHKIKQAEEQKTRLFWFYSRKKREQWLVKADEKKLASVLNVKSFTSFQSVCIFMRMNKITTEQGEAEANAVIPGGVNTEQGQHRRGLLFMQNHEAAYRLYFKLAKVCAKKVRHWTLLPQPPLLKSIKMIKEQWWKHISAKRAVHKEAAENNSYFILGFTLF